MSSLCKHCSIQAPALPLLSLPPIVNHPTPTVIKHYSLLFYKFGGWGVLPRVGGGGGGGDGGGGGGGGGGVSLRRWWRFGKQGGVLFCTHHVFNIDLKPILSVGHRLACCMVAYRLRHEFKASASGPCEFSPRCLPQTTCLDPLFPSSYRFLAVYILFEKHQCCF